MEKNISPLSLSDINNLSRNNVNKFDKSACNQYSQNANTASDIFFAGFVISPLVLFADKNIKNDYLTIGIMYTETLLFAGALINISKVTVKRIRPYAYNNIAPLEEKLKKDTRLSFFSGHTAVAFASAMFVSTVYSDYFPDSNVQTYIYAGTLCLASVVGCLRYKAGKHFPTDIISGAIIGSSIGYFIPKMHLKNNNYEIGMNYYNKTLEVGLIYKF